MQEREEIAVRMSAIGIPRKNVLISDVCILEDLYERRAERLAVS